MSSFWQLLGSIGGAASAQAGGGQAGLQAFLDRVAKQQADQLARQYDREKTTRQQQFTADQNALDRDLRRELVNKTEDKQAEADRVAAAQQAQSLLVWAGEDPTRQKMISEAITRTTPNVPPESLSWDPDSRNVIKTSLTNALVQGGPGIGETIREGAQFETEARAFATQSGAVVAPTPFALSQQQARYATNRKQLDQLSGRITQLNTAASDLADDTGSLEEAYKKSLLLAKEVEGLSTELETLKRDNSDFFNPTGGGLFSTAAQIRERLGAVTDAVILAQRSRGVDAMGHWEPRNGFADMAASQPGYGGADGEEDVFEWVVNKSASFTAKATEFDGKAQWLLNLSDSELGTLSPAIQDLVKDLADYQADNNNESISLKKIALQWRESTEGKGYGPGGIPGFDAGSLDNLATELGSFNKEAAIEKIKRHQSRVTDLQAVITESSLNEALSRFGVNLLPDEEVANDAINSFGFKEEDGRMRGPRTQAEFELFFRRVASSPSGIKTLVTAATNNLVIYDPDDEDDTSITFDHALEQGQAQLDKFVRSLGIEDPAVMQQIDTALKESFGKLGDSLLTTEHVGESIGRVPTRDVVNFFNDRRSNFSALSQKEQDEVAKNLDEAIFGQRVSAVGLAAKQQYWRGKFEEPRKGSVTKGRGLTQQLFEGPGAVAPGKQEIDGGITVYDLKEQLTSIDPVFSRLLNQPGSIGEQSQGSLSYWTSGVLGSEYKDWATGKNANKFMRGDASFVARYKQKRREEPINLDLDARYPLSHREHQDELNQLEILDFYRARDIGAIDGLTTENRLLMSRTQEALRNMSYEEALTFIREGFSLESLGLTQPTTPDEREDARSVAIRQPQTLLMGIDVDQIAQQVAKERRRINRMPLGTVVDVAPGKSEQELIEFDELERDAQIATLDQTSQEVEAIKWIQNASQIQDAQNSLATLVQNSKATTGEALTKYIDDNQFALMGLRSDSVMPDLSPIADQVAAMKEAGDMPTQIAKAVGVTNSVAIYRAQAMKERAVSGAQADLLLKGVRNLDDGVNVQIRLIAANLANRAASPDFEYARLPGDIQSKLGLKAEEFDALLKTSDHTQTDNLLLLGLHLWAAMRLASGTTALNVSTAGTK